MTCQSCKDAQANPASPVFASGCLECAARMIAQNPDVFGLTESRKNDFLEEGYKNAVRQVFGEDWKNWHLRIKFWSTKLCDAQPVESH